MDDRPILMQGTTIGSGRDIIGVRRDQVLGMIEAGKELIQEGKQKGALPDGALTGATAALMVAIAGFGEPLSETQWRELGGVVGGLMQDEEYPDLGRLRSLVNTDQLGIVARNAGYNQFIRRQEDGRWVCLLAVRPTVPAAEEDAALGISEEDDGDEEG
ncbi:MAG: hypothetical protein ACYDAY_09065 [Candidatus Dormibacteria bacterium]